LKNVDSTFIHDIEKTGEMFQCGVRETRFNSYDRVYFDTNEACDDIISKFDFKDKKVLTVLASGDQAFQFYKNGAKSVDLFDINKLTFYYYYLRIWNMRKYHEMYPRWDKLDNNYINELLLSVKPESKDELLAYNYWICFINKFDSKMIKRFLIPPYYADIYSDSDLELILEKIDNDSFKFYHADISGIFDVPQKYDFIYTSNLSDYVKKDKLVLYRENLYNYLNKGGILLSSCLNGAETEQKRFMKKYFKYRKLFSYDEDLCSLDLVGYRYKKRMVKRII